MALKELILLVLIIVVVLFIAWIKPSFPYSYEQLGNYKLVAVIPEIETRIYEVEINKQICGVAVSNSFGADNYAISISCP